MNDVKPTSQATAKWRKKNPERWKKLWQDYYHRNRNEILARRIKRRIEIRNWAPKDRGPDKTHPLVKEDENVNPGKTYEEYVLIDKEREKLRKRNSMPIVPTYPQEEPLHENEIQVNLQ